MAVWGLIVFLCGSPVSGQIYNIDTFWDVCPTEDPAYGSIRQDFSIRCNGVVVSGFSCNSPVSTIPVFQYTDEIIVLSLNPTYGYDLRTLSGFRVGLG